MALTLLHRTLKVSLEAYRAEAEFAFASVADIPLRGSYVDWVAMIDGTPIGDQWYLADRQLAPSTFDVVTLVARQPGIDWTWPGLRPIQHRSGTYTTVTLAPSSTFSNWADGDAIAPASQRTIELEFIDTEPHELWLYQANGDWPPGVPLAIEDDVAGLYACWEMEIQRELDMDPLTGSSRQLYRHFCTLRQAPKTTLGKQLLWGYASWGTS